MIGRVLEGKYSVVRRIGEGKLFTVYLAVNVNSNEVAAVKLIRPEIDSDRRFLERFGHEARLLDELDCAFAARLLDFGQDEGTSFIVQEYVPGRTLSQILADEGALQPERALGIVQQMAQCLVEADNAGIVHADVRPANVMLSSGFLVKLLNYGVARSLDLPRLIANGEVALPHYLAPELAMGEQGDVRADVYSLGVILFELLTGRPPYDGPDGPTICLRHLQEPIPSLSAINPDLSLLMDRLIVRCLAKEPADRFLPVELVRSIADILGEVEIAPGEEGALAGQTLGRYQLLERVGRGGMSAVYKAYQSGLDRYVAVKVLPAYLAHDPAFAARFRREARAIARLNHPNILAIHDFGHEGDLSYIVMKYVDGGTLKALLGNPLPLGRSVAIIDQIAAALDHAHSQGIVHRDVKPGNVLMASPDWAILADFGLAQMRGSSVHLSSTGASIGTPDYISPEQAQGLPADARSDVYSLAVMAYEMLTGKIPFESETAMGVVIKHITSAPTPPRHHNPGLSPRIEAIILKALSKEPGQRPASAGEFAAALRQAAEEWSAMQTPSPARHEPTGRRPAHSAPRGWPILLSAVAILALAVIFGLVQRPWEGGSPKASSAIATPLGVALRSTSALVAPPTEGRPDVSDGGVTETRGANGPGAALIAPASPASRTPVPAVSPAFPSRAPGSVPVSLPAVGLTPAETRAPTPSFAAVAAQSTSASAAPSALPGGVTTVPAAGPVITGAPVSRATDPVTRVPQPPAAATGADSTAPTAARAGTSTPRPTTTAITASTRTAVLTATATTTALQTSATSTPSVTVTATPPTRVATRTPVPSQSPTVAATPVPDPGGLLSGPMLLDPAPGHLSGDGRASFSWKWDEALGPEDCFELAMSGSPQGPFWGAVACMKETNVTFNVLDAQHIVPAPGGEYYWTVRVNRKLGDDEWSTISATSEPRLLKVSGGSDGGSGGGKSGPPPP